jgi:hypothetical protein
VDIAAWLHGLGLQLYEQAFRANEIDETVLPTGPHHAAGWPALPRLRALCCVAAPL